MNERFRKLRFKMLWRMVWIVLATAIGSFLLLYTLAESARHGALKPVVQAMCRLFGIDTGELVMFYYGYREWLFLGIGALMVLLAVYLTLSQFARYLNSISRAMDQVFDESSQPIVLAPELYPVQKRLNTIKGDLARRQMEARQSEQRKNDLVVYLAHDIRTPLTSITGYLSLLRETPDLPAGPRAHYIDVAYDKSLKLADLVDELFDVTRFNAQDLTLTLRQVNLNRMLAQLQDEFYPQLTQKKLQCQVRAEGRFELVCDADLLARALDNLLRNAISYSPEGARIIVDVARDAFAPDAVRITFTNEGITIPPEKLARVFEKFYRADEARASASGGAGVGLAIVKRIVEAHAGAITAESANMRTAFSVVLPLSGPPEGATQPPSPLLAPPITQGAPASDIPSEAAQGDAPAPHTTHEALPQAPQAGQTDAPDVMGGGEPPKG
nr:HAMP domain-containing sensor histidine kinase [Maliibacterium massiliense]